LNVNYLLRSMYYCCAMIIRTDPYTEEIIHMIIFYFNVNYLLRSMYYCCAMIIRTDPSTA